MYISNSLSFILVFLVAQVLNAPIALNSCTSITYGHSWNQGLDGQISFTFPETVTEWEAYIKFDKPLKNLRVYQGEVTKISKKKWKITNKSYNGQQTAGSVLTSGWQADFKPKHATPKIVKATLVSPSCKGSSNPPPPTSTTTETPFTSSCAEVDYGHSWNQGQQGDIALTIPSSTTSWEAVVTFNKPLNQLHVYNAEVTKISDTEYKLSNKNFNGVQSAGSVVSSGWQAQFADGSGPVKMTSATLVYPPCEQVSSTAGPSSTTALPTSTTSSQTTVSTNITTTPTTTSTTTISTTISTTTSTTASTTSVTLSTVSISGCNVDVKITNSWHSGVDGELILQTDDSVNGWGIEIFFEGMVDSVSFYTANVDSISDGTVTISNEDYNAQLNAGSSLSLPWQALFSGDEVPTVLGVKMNGQECTFVPSSTTTPSTTASSSSSTTTGHSSTVSSSTTTEQPSTVFPTTTGASTTDSVSSTSSGTTTESSTGSCLGVTKYNYDEVIGLSNLFYQAQRSGPLNQLGDFNDTAIPYRADSCLEDGQDNGVDLVGGYFDAGDYVKFNFPMAAATTLLAWGAGDFNTGYSAAGQMEATLNTIKWATDYFIKCHVSPNELYAQVGDGNADHSLWTRVEDMTIARPSYKIDASNPGSDLAGETSAALAAASIAFADSDPAYSAELLEHSEELFDFADQYRGKYSDSVSAASSFYNSWSGYEDELLWSAAWLYKATGDSAYLDKARGFFTNKDVKELSWDEKTIGATILLAQLTGEDQFVSKAASFCNDMADSQQKTPKGMVWIQQWGPLRHASNVAFACLEAAKIDDSRIDKEKFYQFAVDQIHYALGDTGRSFVVGYGVNPPQRPHHRSSSCPVDPTETCGWDDYNQSGPNPSTLWGALVGGPGSDDSYEDDRGDYIKNEVACDYNAGFQSALAGLRTLAAEGSLPGLDGTSC